MSAQRYDIVQAARGIAAGRTIYRKRIEVKDPHESPIYPYVEFVGTGYFELREVTRAEYYAQNSSAA